MGLERHAPGGEVKRRTEGSGDPGEGVRVYPDGGGEHRHIARERLEHGQPEALALGGHDDGARRVDEQRHPLGGDPAEREQLDADGTRQRQCAVVALLDASGIGRKQQVRTLRVKAQLGARLRVRERLEALDIHPAGQHLCPPRRPASQQRGERRGDGRDQVDERQHSAGRQPCSGMEQIGAVHGQRTHARGDRKGGPGGEAEVRVDNVKAPRGGRRGTMTAGKGAAQVRRRARQCARPWRELVQLHLHVAQCAHRVDLIAHEAAALGVGGVGKHVGDHERAHDPPDRSAPYGMMARVVSSSANASDPRRRPIGVFDSGVGGLTVLHELLVQLPHEDFVYLGDTARFPYGERTADELARFSSEIAEELLRRRTKLLVVACNSATAAALPRLQRRMMDTTLGVDVLGVVRPEAFQAVAATRSGRIGLLATPATVASRAYEEAVGTVDPYVTLHAVACPTLAAIIQAGEQFDERAVETVREACAPLRDADVDTVILGCTHYPLISPMLQRMLGPDVALVSSGAALARQVEHALSTRGLGNPTVGEGDYDFLCTGDGEAFHELGTRFLQMPLGAVERVELAAVEAIA
jgi:glutamate racemase